MQSRPITFGMRSIEAQDPPSDDRDNEDRRASTHHVAPTTKQREDTKKGGVNASRCICSLLNRLSA